LPTTAVIVDAVRTPSGKGKVGGGLSPVHPANLLETVLRALGERNGLDLATVDDVIAGCVGQNRDQALNIARTALLCGGYPESVPGTTIDRQCGSSQQAAHFAAQGVMAGVYDVVIACGVESMSRVPMASAADGGEPLEPLAVRYPDGLVHQGIGAELIAGRRGFTRTVLDEFSARSHERAARAVADGAFDREIIPVHLPDGGVYAADETVRGGTTVEQLAGLRSAFEDPRFAERFPEIGWHITPGNSSPMTDGASAVLIMSGDCATASGLRPRARFHTMAITGSDPLVILDGVIPATQKALSKSGLTLDDIDVYEVNEAFAPVPLAWAQELGADERRLNPLGGAIALGHPLGASGTRILTTMLHHLEATGGRFGLMTICEGGGMANATIIERL
jgi:acetyl-CoA acyltransferase